MNRYEIEAKRRNTDESFTAWTVANNYGKALAHEAHVENLGYEARIVTHPEVREMWDILSNVGGGVRVQADAIFDADFRKASTVRRSTTMLVSRTILKKLFAALESGDIESAIFELADKYGVTLKTEDEEDES